MSSSNPLNDMPNPMPSHLAGVAALGVVAYYLLPRYLAVLSASPPQGILLVKESTATSADEEIDGVETPPAPPRRKWFTRKTFMSVLECLTLLAFMGFVIFFTSWLLPRIATQTIVDVFWSLYLIYIMSIFFRESFRILIPVPKVAILVYKDDSVPSSGIALQWKEIEGRQPKHFGPESRSRKAAALLLSLCVLASSYYGTTWLYPLFTGAATLSMSTVFFNQTSIRRIVQGGLALEGVLCITICLVNLYQTIWPSLESTTPPEKKNSAMETRWIAGLLIQIMHIVAVVFPGILINVNIRYDYLRDNVRPTRGAAGEPGEIPSSLGRFRPTIFHGSMVGTTLGLVTLDLLLLFVRQEWAQNVQCMGYFTSVGGAIVGSVVAAWWNGQLRQWWGYYEEWTPKIESLAEETSAVDDVEKYLESEKLAVPISVSVPAEKV